MATSDTDPQPDRNRWHLGLVLLLSALVFAPSLVNEFARDDLFIAKASYPDGSANPMISELRPLPDYFRSHYWAGYHDNSLEYRPITVWSYAAVYFLVGERLAPTGFGEALPQHLINLLLHVIAVYVVCRLLLAGGLTRTPALLGALVFGVHAIHSEVVASIVGRAELLAFVLGGGSTLLAWRSVEATGRIRPWGLAGASILYFLALCSKEIAVVWPGWLGVLLWTRFRHQRGCGGWPAIRRSAAPAVAVAALPLLAFFALRAWMHSQLGADRIPTPEIENPLVAIDGLSHALTAIKVWGYGLALTAFPFRLASDYGASVFEMVHSPFDAGFLAAFVALAFAAAGGWIAGRRHPALLLAMAAFFGFSFVISNLPITIGTIFGERLYYAPSLGLAFVVAWCAMQLRTPVAIPPLRSLATVVCVSWIVACSWIASQRCGAWRNDETLFLADVESQPRSSRIHELAARTSLRMGDYERMDHHIERAMALRPDPAKGWLEMGWAMASEGQWRGASRALERGIETAEHGAPAYLFHLHWSRAKALDALGRKQEAGAAQAAAIEQLQRLAESSELQEELFLRLARQPAAAQAWLELAQHFLGAQNGNGALSALAYGLRNHAGARDEAALALHWSMAGLLRMAGNESEAQQHLDRARHIDADEIERRLRALGAT